MDKPKDPEAWNRAEKLWYLGDLEHARHLFKSAIDGLAKAPAGFPESHYLSLWAYLEATQKERDRFEALYKRVFDIEPASPFYKLSYARTLWTEFGDGDACARAVAALESLIAPGQPVRDGDLAILAYQKKIETLRAWMRGEPGGPIWP
jgi:tetratricopeptide (TPR) repeat protein